MAKATYNCSTNVQCIPITKVDQWYQHEHEETMPVNECGYKNSGPNGIQDAIVCNGIILMSILHNLIYSRNINTNCIISITYLLYYTGTYKLCKL